MKINPVHGKKGIWDYIILLLPRGKHKKTHVLPSLQSFKNNCKTAESVFYWTCFSLIFSFAIHIPAQKLRKGKKRVKI